MLLAATTQYNAAVKQIRARSKLLRRHKRSVICAVTCSRIALLCEGGCNSNVHQHCVGVTRCHYEELSASSNPFVCQLCALKRYTATVQQLQTEMEGLKSELASVKAALSEQVQLPHTHAPSAVDQEAPKRSYAAAVSANGA